MQFFEMIKKATKRNKVTLIDSYKQGNMDVAVYSVEPDAKFKVKAPFEGNIVYFIMGPRDVIYVENGKYVNDTGRVNQVYAISL